MTFMIGLYSLGFTTTGFTTMSLTTTGLTTTGFALTTVFVFVVVTTFFIGMILGLTILGRADLTGMTSAFGKLIMCGFGCITTGCGTTTTGAGLTTTGTGGGGRFGAGATTGVGWPAGAGDDPDIELVGAAATGAVVGAGVV
jgi:hypothetical protein